MDIALYFHRNISSKTRHYYCKAELYYRNLNFLTIEMKPNGYVMVLIVGDVDNLENLCILINRK